MTDFRLKEGDTEPPLTVTLKRDGSAFDLSTVTNASVQFRMGATDEDPQVDASATIVDAGAGEVQYDWQSGDTDTAGTYNCEFVVTGDNNYESTFPVDGYIVGTISREVQST